MSSRANLLLPLPSCLILRPICRGTRIQRLSIGRKRDGGEVLEESDEEERRFVVGELMWVRIVELAAATPERRKRNIIYLLPKTYPWTGIEREEYERIRGEVLV